MIRKYSDSYYDDDDEDDDEDDDDDDDLTVAHFPENPASGRTKQAVAKMPLDWKKQTKYEIVRTAVSHQSVRETALTSCGILPCIPCNQIAPGTYPWYCMYTCTLEKNKKKTKKTRRGLKKE